VPASRERRRASQQLAQDLAEEAVAYVRPGRSDVLFYARSGGTGRIYHDALYAGGGRVIEAALSDGITQPVTTEARIFGPDYWGAVRFLRS
jgi:cell wall-associated NlpC family hydrolase